MNGSENVPQLGKIFYLPKIPDCFRLMIYPTIKTDENDGLNFSRLKLRKRMRNKKGPKRAPDRVKSWREPYFVELFLWKHKLVQWLIYWFPKHDITPIGLSKIISDFRSKAIFLERDPLDLCNYKLEKYCLESIGKIFV